MTWSSKSVNRSNLATLRETLKLAPQAEHNAFFMCDKFEKPHWLELLPAEGPDSDAFDEELKPCVPLTACQAMRGSR